MKCIALALALAGLGNHATGDAPANLRVGFGARDITPALDKPVYLAGFGKNRLAKGVHDPLLARVVVLADGERKIALASVDLVGLFLPVIEHVRQRLPGFTYVLVSSTHNHEGPDTLGLWGPSAFQSGIDPAYLKKVEDALVQAVGDADKSLTAATARIGSVQAPELVHDGRQPYVKHDDLVVLQFQDGAGKKLGIVVQWNCHPETLGSKNTDVSADYVGATVGYLQDKHKCPVVYLTGTVGGLLSSLGVEVKDEQGNALQNGTVAKTMRYGQLVGMAADRALARAKPVTLTPIAVQRRDLFLPLDNKLYLLASKLRVLDRQPYVWKGDSSKAEPYEEGKEDARKCIKTEIGWLRLGELDVAAIPGEIYPELVLGKVQDPPDAGADFPDAAVEPSIYGQLKGPHRLIIGLANDEVGYIIPKRQWDEKAPFCYGRKAAQYGEVNSLGVETAPLLCEAFRDLTQRKKKTEGK